jgi:hypothetical protein
MLAHLVFRTLRTVSWVALIAILVGIAGASVRLLPWLVASDVPLSVSFVFFRAIAPASVEVALFLALPLGCAIETARWVHDGTVMTLRTLGLGPVRQLSNLAVVTLLVSLACLLVSTQSARLANSPGNVSNRLIQAAEANACRKERCTRVPLLEVAWLCPGGSSRLVGRFPATGHAAMAWTASGATFSDSLDRIELRDVRWVSEPAITIRAHTVVVSGIVPWMAPGAISPWLRGVATALSCALVSLAAAWALLRWPSASRPRAVIVAVSGMLGFLLMGGVLLERLSWFGLFPLAALGTLVPIVVAHITRFARLLETRQGGTKRETASNSVVAKVTDV